MKKLFVGALLLSTVTLAMAQAWPTAKPIRIVVAYPAGGVSDTVARALADKLAVQLGTPVVIENKAGASGSLGVDAVAKAAPDGYTLGFAAVSPLALNPHLGKSPFDPQKDIAPVVSVMYSPVLLLGTSASKAADFKDIIATAQAKPRAVRWATSGQASLGHIMLEQIMGKSQVQITHVPYKGGGQAMTDVMGGSIPLVYTAVAGAQGHVKAGKLKALAVTTARRSAAMPEVPTIAEAGVKNVDVYSWQAVVAPKGLPADVRTLVEARRLDIVSGRLLPFAAPLVDNQGKVRLANGALDDAAIAGMDWLVQGVVGSVPQAAR